jgi:hypothetical protein
MSNADELAVVQPQDVVTVEREGIAVEVDLSYMRSWEGIVRAADMQSERLDEMQRFVAVVEYYRGACPNIDEVDGALRERNGGSITANDVMEFVGAAIKEATPKN